MKYVKSLLSLIAAMCMGSSVWAFDFNGNEITASGATVTTNQPSGDLMLTYKTSGTLQMSQPATASILAVGGGGSGAAGSGSGSSNRGQGGNGGEVKEWNGVAIPNNVALTISVGGGGASSSSGVAGSAGSASSVVISGTSYPAEGGAGGALNTNSAGTGASGTGATGVTSTIDGNTYGEGGLAAPSSSKASDATANTGNGGQGGRNANSTGNRASGAGGSGIVVIRIAAETPAEGTDTISIGQSRTKEYTTESDLTTALVTAGDSYLEKPTVSGKTVSITAKSTANVSATVKLYNGETLVKVLTVNITEAPSQVEFGGVTIEYQNGTADLETVPGELLLTFTNTAAAGAFSLPKDFGARVLVVGGGAGGVATVGTSGGAALSGNGGRAGRVFEKKLSDDFTLPAGTFEITVGAGGSANEPSDDSTNASFVGGNGGSPSSLIGAGIDLSAKGGKAWATSGKPSKLAEENDPKGPGNSDSGVRTKDQNNSYTSWSGRGAGMPDGEDFDEYDHNPLGYDSDITGETVTYGVGGAGTNCTYASASRSEAKTGVTAQPNTGNGGGGASMNANSGAGGSGIVIVRLFSKNYTITTVADPVEGGTVTGGGEYAPDAEATLTATANAGYRFVKWSDGDTTNPRNITVTEDKTYTAEFQWYLVDVVPADVDNATATVYTNGVPVMGDPIRVETNAVFEIVYETDGDNMFSDLTTVKTNSFTATENPMTDTATFEVVGRVAQIGDVKYTSINEAFATLTNNVGHDVTVKILRDFDEVLTNDYLLANNVTITTDVEDGVTVDFGFREGKDVFGIDENLPGTLTITENVAIKGLGQLVSGYGTLNNVVNIAGDLTAGQVWAYKGIVNVLPTAKVVATYGKGDVSIYNSGTVNVEGTGTNEVQVQGISFLGKNKGDKSFVLSNTFVKVQCLTNEYKTGSFTLNLDSARFEADGDKGMDFGTVSVNTINMTADSFIATIVLTNLTAINIDSTGLKGAVKLIDILGSQAMELKDFGTVTVTGGGEAYVVDNDLWVKASATEIPVPTAIEDLVYNGNVQTGVLAGVGYTITGNEARNAGYHDATAKLEEGYVWAGGLEGDQKIKWYIAKRPITVTPNGGQSKIFGKPYTITYTTNGVIAAGDKFTGALEPSYGEEGSDVLIEQGSLAIDDGNDGQNYNLTFIDNVEIHIYAASQDVNPTSSDPIKVDTEWIQKNLPGVDPENEGDVSAAMAVGCPNQNDLWVNYVLNTDTNESIRVVSSQAVNGVVFDLNSLGIRPDSGATVHAMVEFTGAEGVPSTVFEDKELPISITDITESGIYTVSFWIKNKTEEDSTTTVTVGNDEVGALVKDAYKSGPARELVSVPWSDLASEDGDITVENFLVTANLAAGTKLYSLAEGGEYYNAWELSSDKKWTPVKTVKIEGGVVTVQESDTADKATLKCGTGVWVERADASAKLVFVGATDDPVTLTPAPGMNLMSRNDIGELDIKETFNSANENDRVIVPTGDVPTVYTYKDGAWGYDKETVSTTTGGKTRIKVERTTEGDMKVGNGAGFWYDRKDVEPPK